MLAGRRVQHAVGQGCFHSGEIREDHELRHRYVYDCGAISKYAKQRDGCIDGYLSHFAARDPLHSIFLSHAHADHVNGVERLLHPSTGLNVDTIVLPLINVTDRLIAFARTASEDAAAAQTEFYRTFVADPTAALSRFDPR